MRLAYVRLSFFLPPGVAPAAAAACCCSALRSLRSRRSALRSGGGSEGAAEEAAELEALAAEWSDRYGGIVSSVQGVVGAAFGDPAFVLADVALPEP